VLRSQSRKETHHFGKAGAVTLCGSKGSGIKRDVQHRYFSKLTQTNFIAFFMHIYYNFLHRIRREQNARPGIFHSFERLAIEYSRVGAEAASKFLPGAGAA
jgi:hypothetical protein